MRTPLLIVLALLSCLPGARAAPAADGGTVDVEVVGIERAAGQILVALCTAGEYLSDDCSHGGAAPAVGERGVVSIRDVPPGRYAVLVLQDLDGDQRLKRNLIGIPREPVGFGNDAPIRFGPPSFEAAAIDVGPAGARTRVTLRYR